MMTNPPFSDQQIIKCLNTHYGIDVAMLKFLPLSADYNVFIYKAGLKNQSSCFVKLTRSCHLNISMTIAALLHNAGIKQIIPLIKTSQGQQTLAIGDFTLLVYPFIVGQDGFSRDLAKEQWITLGKVLRKVHEMTISTAIKGLLRQENYSPKWREAVRALYIHMATCTIVDVISCKLKLFINKHTTLIHQLVDRAEALSLKVQSMTVPFVLCHADIHGGNVLISEKGNLYLVDWDAPMLAPKERDLMFIGAGVGNVWNKPPEVAFFYHGYGKTEVNKTILAYYRLERIVEDIALFAQQILLTSASEQDREKSYQHFTAQFEPQGVVEIALHTENNL